MALFKKFSDKLKSLFKSNKIDEEFFENLEDTLIEGDLGAKLSDEIITELKKVSREKKLNNTKDLIGIMKNIISTYVFSFDFSQMNKKELKVWLILGVNGVGKTTTIAKMGKYFNESGEKVLLAAADTFRAAAVDQLDIHAERLKLRIVKQNTGSDPGAVVFDALTSAKAQNDTLVLSDTAGRMHNKENLMKEIQKIDKIIKGRGVKEENYKKFLVIDATTGQNGLSQALLFNQVVSLDGIILTKYDSAAKGGAIVQIGKMLKLPIVFVCDGESYDDIAPFNKEAFIDSLMGINV